MKILNKLISRLNISSSRINVLRNIYWAVLGKVLNIVSGLFVGILVARYLGPEQYGLMSYVVSYVTLFSIFASFGFDNIEIRELSKNNHKKDLIIGTALSLRLLLAFLTIVLISITAVIYEADKFTTWMIITYSFSLIFNTFSVIKNYFISIVDNKYIVKTEIIRTIVGAIIKVILLIFKAPLEWFIIAITFDFVIIAGGYLHSYKNKVGKLTRCRFDKKIAIYQIRESIPLLLSGAAILLYQTIDQIMIRNMINNEAVGQYVVAAKLAEIIVFIPMIIAQTITPLLVQARANDLDLYEIKKKEFFDIIFWSTILFCLILSLAANPLIMLLYGVQYSDAIPVLQIIAWKAVFAAMFASSGQIIIIEHKHNFAVLRNLIGCIFNISLNLILIPIMGIIGSAIVSIVTLLITGYLSHSIIKPYRIIFKQQTDSIFYGLPRLLKKTLLK